MALTIFVALLVTDLLAQRATVPVCESEPGCNAERITGAVNRDETFVQTTAAGWILRLVPTAEGWFLQVTTGGREKEDLSRLTPPWHFVPKSGAAGSLSSPPG